MRHRVSIALICGAIALGFLGSRHTSQAQQAQDPSYQAISDKFFNMLQQDEAYDAMDYILDTNPEVQKYKSNSPTSHSEMQKEQFASLQTRIGPYISHTLLVETKVADRFAYQHFFVVYERQPISIRITYYRPGATWFCYGLTYDENVVGDLIKVADDNLSNGVK
jgi:hypothetical protein